MRSFNSMLDEQMDDPEFATVFEAEIERLNAAVAVSRAREEARLTQEQLAERSGVYDVPQDALPEEFVRSAEQATGGEIAAYQLSYYGICSNCKNSK